MKVTAEIRDLTEAEKDALRLAARDYSEEWEDDREDFELKHGDDFDNVADVLMRHGLVDLNYNLTSFGKAALEQIGGAA